MSEEIPLHQPNDKLFKQTFSDPKTASGFLRAYLPASVVEAIDWGALKIEPTSFIDPNYQKFESDLLHTYLWNGALGSVCRMCFSLLGLRGIGLRGRWRNGIVAMTTERVAAKDSAQAQPAAS